MPVKVGVSAVGLSHGNATLTTSLNFLGISLKNSDDLSGLVGVYDSSFIYTLIDKRLVWSQTHRLKGFLGCKGQILHSHSVR